MSLSCDYDGDDFDWHFTLANEQAPLSTKRSRKCCSCGSKIAVGDLCQIAHRNRQTNCGIEYRIYGGDDVPMSDWHLCETCADLAESLTEQGFCFSLGDVSLKEQIAEYRDDNP